MMKTESRQVGVEKHSSIKRFFKKEPSPAVETTQKKSNANSSSSVASSANSILKEKEHHGISKLFHHSGPSAHERDNVATPQTQAQINRTRSTSAMSKKVTPAAVPLTNKSSTNHEITPTKSHLGLPRASTINNSQFMRSVNSASQASMREIRAPVASIRKHMTSDSLIIGDLGGKKGGYHDQIVYNPYGINDSSLKKPDASFYLASGSSDVLPLPMAEPNDYLPGDLKLTAIELTTIFEIVKDDKLGDGASGDVRKLHHRGLVHSKQQFALKKFTLFPKEDAKEFYKRATKEYIIARRLNDNVHIVDTIALVKVPTVGTLSRGWGFIMEFCMGGDLFGLITKPGWRSTSAQEKLCVFKQIVFGVKYMHDNGIVHRDLKPENVLLGVDGFFKLTDFGVSEYAHEIESDITSPLKKFTSYVGSPPYSSPEVMKLKEYTESKRVPYDPYKMDCWGLGMLLFCIFYCGTPFSQASQSDVQYRDYISGYRSYAAGNPTFAKGTNHINFPGSQFKFAKEFHNMGMPQTARLAWKLCDPSPETRFTINSLLEDQWFMSLEMCLHEEYGNELKVKADYEELIKIPPKNRSRTNTLDSMKFRPTTPAIDTDHKSMLDVEPVSSSNASVKSSSSLTDSRPANSTADSSSIRLRKNSSEDSIKEIKKVPKVRSMLDVTSAPKEELPSLAEEPVPKEVITKANGLSHISEESPAPTDDLEKISEVPSSKEAESTNGDVVSDNTLIASKPSPKLTVTADTNGEVNPMIHKDLKRSDSTIGSAGISSYGYRIKKHHHLDVRNVGSSGQTRTLTNR